jgi:fluoride exporter
MDLIVRILCVGGGGALGALARWGITWMVEAIGGRRLVELWPLATLAVNGLGCFFFGLFFELLRHRVPLGDPWRLVIFVGFFGAFTTYSTFAFDAYRLHTEQSLASALSYVLVQVVVGWAALLSGLYLARVIV